MRRGLGVILAAVALGLPLVVGEAGAHGCVVRTRTFRYAPPAVISTVVTPAVAIKEVALAEPVAVQVPVYQAVYGGGADGLLQQLLGEVQRLRAEVASLRGYAPAAPGHAPMPPAGPGAAPEKAPPQKAFDPKGPHAALQTFGTVCASCHEANVSRAKGGGFTLVKGGALVELSEAQRFRLQREVFSGRMPKGSKLTDQQVGEIFDYVDSLP